MAEDANDANSIPRLRAHIFTPGDRVIIVDGKSHWPDCLHLHLSRRDAWRLLNSLVALDIDVED